MNGNRHIAPDVEQKYNRAVRVISGWVNAKNFTDELDNPRVLPLTDEEGSFADLIKQYSGDITPQSHAGSFTQG